ncbi:hypothetical protein [Herbaspirillum huttiense]|uniref:Uncharacterized protein n=1 Tax=Herbaspirillum huttiense subsp. lycopersici TaxID=3074428 RepID=A0ABU2ET64_9BURK|nr:hypothetical protein [Herbaspirillum huttiense]MDR9851372.1 hypothetical protein [Herbaspirillum huttiense SE1]
MVAADSAGIAFTFNAAIGMGAEKALAEGIPAVGGCPVARSFFELASCNQFIWVNVLECQSFDITRRIELNQRGEIFNNDAPNVFSDDEILHLIETESRWVCIQQFMEAVKQIKAAGGPERFFGPFRMFSGYKPIYFLLA